MKFKTNTEINKDLKYGEKKKFAKFLGMSKSGLIKRLKNNGKLLRLDSQYRSFIEEERNSKPV